MTQPQPRSQPQETRPSPTSWHPRDAEDLELCRRICALRTAIREEEHAAIRLEQARQLRQEIEDELNKRLGQLGGLRQVINPRGEKQ